MVAILIGQWEGSVGGKGRESIFIPSVVPPILRLCLWLCYRVHCSCKHLIESHCTLCNLMHLFLQYYLLFLGFQHLFLAVNQIVCFENHSSLVITSFYSIHTTDEDLLFSGVALSAALPLNAVHSHELVFWWLPHESLTQNSLDVSKTGGSPPRLCETHRISSATHHTRASRSDDCRRRNCGLELGTSRLVEDWVASITVGPATPVLGYRAVRRFRPLTPCGWSDRSATFDVWCLSTRIQYRRSCWYWRRWPVWMPLVHFARGVLVVVEITAWSRAAAALWHWSEISSTSLIRRWWTSIGQRLAAVVVTATGCQCQLHVSKVLIMSTAVVVDVIRTTSNPAHRLSTSITHRFETHLHIFVKHKRI